MRRCRTILLDVMVSAHGEELSADERLIVATIEQRFRWLADAGHEPVVALILATHTEIPLTAVRRVLLPAA